MGGATLGGRGAPLSGRLLLIAMAEARPMEPVGPTGVPTVGPGGPGGAEPRGGHLVRPAGPGPQPAPQPPPAPQPTPEPGPTQTPLDDTRFLIASTNWY